MSWKPSLSVGTSFGNNSELLEASVKKTWLSKPHPNFNHFFFYGGLGEDKFLEEERELYLDCPDGPTGAYQTATKTVKMFEFALNNFDFDFLFRVNITPYLHLDNLYAIFSNLPKNNIYGGCFGTRNYAHGLGFALSRDMVELIVSNPSNFPHSNSMDDNWYGWFMEHYKIPKTQFAPPIFAFPDLISPGLNQDREHITNWRQGDHPFSMHSRTGHLSFKDCWLMRTSVSKHREGTLTSIARQELLHELFKS